MKILIVSDTHGHDRNLEIVLEKVGPVSYTHLDVYKRQAE